MSENIIEKEVAPQAEAVFTDDKETIPQKSEVFIPIKFNKKVINLSLEQAQELAQKGMKFDLISADYSALKSLAQADGKNVGEYIAALQEAQKAKRLEEITTKCGGDTQFAEHILNLEKGEEKSHGFEELQENFCEIKSIEDLPQSVVEAAILKGTLLLDEYLRYLHKQDKAMKESIKKQKESLESATGAFSNKSGAQSPETAEFLKGLWQR